MHSEMDIHFIEEMEVFVIQIDQIEDKDLVHIN
jgi:hypothetical protein